MIYWNGCSFVRGMEVNNHSKRFAWRVSNHYDTPMINSAKVGGGNDRIWRVVINEVPIFYNPKLVILVWSGINRMEYLNWFPKKKKGRWKSANWANFKWHQTTLDIHTDSRVTKHPEDTPDIWKGLQMYMTHVRNLKYCLIYSLHYMYTTNVYLKALGIPTLNYIMSNTQINKTLWTLDQRFEESANIIWQANQLGSEEWLKRLPWLKEEGFYDMCKREGAPFGPKDHPLEEGHELMANRIIGDIEKNGFHKALI